MKNCLFLGKGFALFVNNERAKKHILEVIGEIERIFEKAKLFDEKIFDSFKFYLKKIEVNYQNILLSSNLRDLKKLLQRISEIYSHKKIT